MPAVHTSVDIDRSLFLASHNFLSLWTSLDGAFLPSATVMSPHDPQVHDVKVFPFLSILPTLRQSDVWVFRAFSTSCSRPDLGVGTVLPLEPDMQEPGPLPPMQGAIWQCGHPLAITSP